MTIPETKKKIHFTTFNIEERVQEKKDIPTMGITNGSLRFSKKLIHELGLAGRFVRLSYDPGKYVIGFQVKEEIDQRVMKEWKMVKPSIQNGTWTVGIKSILARFHGKDVTKNYKSLPVSKYVETDIINRGAVYYFISLNDAEEETEEEPTL